MRMLSTIHAFIESIWPRNDFWNLDCLWALAPSHEQLAELLEIHEQGQALMRLFVDNETWNHFRIWDVSFDQHQICSQKGRLIGQSVRYHILVLRPLSTCCCRSWLLRLWWIHHVVVLGSLKHHGLLESMWISSISSSRSVISLAQKLFAYVRFLIYFTDIKARVHSTSSCSSLISSTEIAEVASALLFLSGHPFDLRQWLIR